jgi:hypothetical protein
MAAPSDPSGSSPPTASVSSRPVPSGLLTLAVVLIVLVAVLGLVVKEITSSTPVGFAPAVQQAPSALVQDVTNIPARVFNKVGDPSPPLLSAPSLVQHGPALLIRGLPAVVWIGALYCPACAAERWALVIALGRFGTFDRLYATTSASSEVYPDTVTFSFDGATYHSTKVALAAVEEFGNEPSQRAPAGYERLAYPTPLETSTMRSYDRAPWANSAQLPFLDVANRIVVSGSSFLPGVLQGLTMQQVATDLMRPSTLVAQEIVGAANQITAAICAASADPPVAVCSSPAVVLTSTLMGLGS